MYIPRICTVRKTIRAGTLIFENTSHQFGQLSKLTKVCQYYKVWTLHPSLQIFTKEKLSKKNTPSYSLGNFKCNFKQNVFKQRKGCFLRKQKTKSKCVNKLFASCCLCWFDKTNFTNSSRNGLLICASNLQVFLVIYKRIYKCIQVFI